MLSPATGNYNRMPASPSQQEWCSAALSDIKQARDKGDICMYFHK